MKKNKNKIDNIKTEESFNKADQLDQRFFSFDKVKSSKIIEKYFSENKKDLLGEISKGDRKNIKALLEKSFNLKKTFSEFSYAEIRLNWIRKRIIKKEFTPAPKLFAHKSEDELNQSKNISRQYYKFLAKGIASKKERTSFFHLGAKRMFFRIEKLWFIFQESILHRAVAVISLLAIVGGVYMQFAPGNVQGATYTWNQATWSGGVTANYPNHTSNKTNWTEYSAKDAGVSAGTELSLTSTAGSANQTSDTDFGAGTNSGTAVSGSAAAGSVELSKTATSGSLVSGFGTNGVYLSNPSSYDDIPNASAQDSSYIYVVGYDAAVSSSDAEWHIEKIDKSTGALVTAFGTNGVIKENATIGGGDMANAIAVDENYLYIGGQDRSSNNEFRIEKRNKTTGALVTAFDSDGILTENPSTSDDYVKAIAVDSSYIYLAGQYSNAGSPNWRIEKRNITTGALVAAFGTSGYINDSSGSVPGTISSDANYIYIAGTTSTGAFRVEKRDITTGAYVAAFNSGAVEGSQIGYYSYPVQLAMDTNYVYVSGYTQYASNNRQWTIEKRDRTTGALVAAFGTSGVVNSNPSAADDGARALAIDGSYIYLAGIDAAASNYEWRLEKRDITSGALISNYGTNGIVLSNPSSRNEKLNSILLDGSSIYLLGEDYSISATDYQWRVEKRQAGADTYGTSGTFASSVINVGQKSNFTTLAYDSTVPASTTLTVDVRAGNTATVDGTWTAWQNNISNGGDISTLNGYQYVQYQANLATTDASITPSLDDITFNYTYYPSSATLTSSSYNTQSSANALAKIQWTETLPSAETDAKFQVQTAPDSGSNTPGSWSGWMGPDGTAASYFTDPTGNEAMPAALTNGSSDQWIQYKVFLSTSSVSDIPTVSDVTFSYTVNAPPEIQNITASQGANGIVAINYEVRDADTNTGVTANAVNITLQYCSANCSTPGGETWTDAATVDGDGTVSGIEQENWASKSLAWTAKTDYANQFNSANFKIRIKADDSEGANRYGYGTSAAFVIDTTDPVAGAHPILVDGSASSNNITLSATDNSALQMKVGLASNLFDGTWESYSATKTLTLVDDPETVYVQFKDAYGNTSAILSATTPETPSATMIQDTSNLLASPAEYRLFTAWKTVANPVPGFGSYKIYRSTSASGPWTSLLYTITDRTMNYYGDSSATLNQSYYYKIVTTDANGNISKLSSTINGKANGIQDEGEGGGGSESSPPTISNVEISEINTTQAIITWDTNELSNSTVGYSATIRNFDNETGVATMKDDELGVGQHRVVLTGLSPATTYYFQAISEDPSHNEGTDKNGTDGYSFTTLSGPIISNVTIPSVNDNSATIAWFTNTSSNSYVVYSTNANMSNSIETGSSSSTTNHQVKLSGLSLGTKYYFYVKSGISIDNNSTNYYSLTTQAVADTTDPVISEVDYELIDNSSAVISWKTDEAATSQVKYGTTSGSANLTSLTTLNSSLNLDHFSTIINLSPDTRYYYQVISKDLSNNEAISSEYYFDTDADPEYQHDALSAISNISDPPSVVTDTKAVVSFNTDQAAKCSIEYGTETKNYSEVPIVESKYNLNHSMHITGLIFSTNYYYQISCEDNLNNTKESSEYSFTTLAEIADDGTVGDTTAPSISGVSVGTITGESATITWSTDEVSNGAVSFGIVSGTYENGAISDLVNSDKDNYVKEHEVIVNNLTPGTKYFYLVRSIDAAGNIGESSEESFTTKSPSSLSSIKVVSTSLREAVITWTTSTKMSSVVEYGETETYGNRKESSSQSTSHEISISGLKSGTPYHFRVKGEDADKNLYSSGDYTFEPKSPPKVSGSSVDSTTERGAKIVVITDIPTDILVTYVDTKDSNNTGSQGKPELATRHDLELANLKPGTTYSYIVKVTDEQGNQTTSEAKTFTTGKDENPPQIIQVKTDSALAQNDKVQTIISWSTDENSTTSFIYKEGISGEEKEVVVSDSYTQSHVVVSTIFKTGTVYHFKVKSVDQSGNENVSSDFALLTPKMKENIVQIIVTNFQDIFGWAGVIGR